MSSKHRVDCGQGVALERGVDCRMSDGVILRSDHYFAAGEGARPTLLMRQPYGRDIASTVVYAHPTWFARRGYNVVIQDVRGRGGSEGDFYPFRNEGKDGAETIAWLHSRRECNGRIGMYGFSYQGATQLLAAAQQPSGLQCIAPAMTACDLYRGWFYHNGALRLASSLSWGLQMLKEDARRLELHEASAKLEAAWENIRSQPMHLPFASHPAITDPGLPSYVRDWFRHDTPGDFWSSMDISKTAEKIVVPALHVSGWYDTYLEGSVRGFELLREKAGSEHARKNQYLLAGPWVHIPWADRVGEAYLGEEALLDTDSLLLRWFDHWLKDAGTFESEPQVRHFALGANEWHESSASRGHAEVVFHLHSHGRAESRAGDGTLSLRCAALEPPDVFVYDPEVPVFGPGGALGLSGMFDQTALEAGNNVLVYTSEPLAHSMHVFGAPRIAVYVSTSAARADLTAKLIRVTANCAEFCCIGIARSTYLFGETYQSDQVYCWEFDLEPTSYVFAKGDHVRLEIAGSAFPLYDRNSCSQTRHSEMTPWNWQRSTHTIFHDADHGSALHLPVVA